MKALVYNAPEPRPCFPGKRRRAG